MRFLILMMLVFFLISCENQRNIGDMKYLNGYWQIQKAEIPDVVIKNYKGGLKLDYIEIKDDSTGIRKKVKVSLRNTFKTTPNQEKIKVFEEERNLKLKCKTPYSKWTENILYLSKDSLIIKNQDNKKFYYSKYQIDETKP